MTLLWWVIKINKKGVMLPANIFATIAIVVLLLIYFFIMAFTSPVTLDIGSAKLTTIFHESGQLGSIDIDTDHYIRTNLYAYLETPISDDEKIIDLLRDYTDSNFVDDSLKARIESLTTPIFDKLNFCVLGKEYFNILTVHKDFKDPPVIIYATSGGVTDKSGIGKLFGQDDVDKLLRLGAVQRIPYDGGVFYVKYNRYTKGARDPCREELSYA